jgi:hypothetical protein
MRTLLAFVLLGAACIPSAGAGYWTSAIDPYTTCIRDGYALDSVHEHRLLLRQLRGPLLMPETFVLTRLSVPDLKFVECGADQHLCPCQPRN